MTTPENANQPKDRLIMTAEEWLTYDFRVEESQILIGTPENSIIRPRTKNIIQASEKTFKTTLLLRLSLGLSTGQTLFRSLPVTRSVKVLYLHGELAVAELKERLQAATLGLKRPLDQFHQGQSLSASLVTDQGRAAIKQLVQEYAPEVLVLDPWQSFIAGADENSFKDVSVAMNFLDRLIAEYGLTVFIAVHEGKNTRKGARGHSSFGGWRDTKFTLSRDGKGKGKGLTVKVEPRWGKPVNLDLTFQGGTLWEGNPPGWTGQAEQIRKLVESNGGTLTRQQLALGLEIKPESVRMALSRAEEKGAITVDGDVITVPSVVPAHSQPL